jgi:hypothetical protein
MHRKSRPQQPLGISAETENKPFGVEPRAELG